MGELDAANESVKQAQDELLAAQVVYDNLRDELVTVFLPL